MTGYPPVIEICGITCNSIMNKKYTLASLENCSKRFLGIKVRIEYLEVLILFRLKSLLLVLSELVSKVQGAFFT